MWRKHNENPAGRNVGDCTVRAIAAATGDSWMKIYIGLCVQGALELNMPSADEVWGKYLSGKGWERRFLPHDCPICYTVMDFCKEHPSGVYILCLTGHVLTVKDGEYLDTWESGDGHPIYYFVKEN